MKDIIVHNRPKSTIAEAYRAIRTNIEFANIDKNIRTILVTSTTPGEGKTTTLANIAATMTQNGERVLVIDCDMRKPRVHKVFEISNKKGLADMLRKEHNYVDYIQRVEDLHLDVLTAGRIPGNPSELLHSKAMKNLIASLKESYDYIFLDTPPVTPVTDATILSGYIDGVILVVSSGAVEIDLAKRAVQSMTTIGANILGVVINKLKVENAKQYQTYYYYQSKEDKEEEEEEDRNGNEII